MRLFRWRRSRRSPRARATRIAIAGTSIAATVAISSVMTNPFAGASTARPRPLTAAEQVATQTTVTAPPRKVVVVVIRRPVATGSSGSRIGTSGGSTGTPARAMVGGTPSSGAPAAAAPSAGAPIAGTPSAPPPAASDPLPPAVPPPPPPDTTTGAS